MAKKKTTKKATGTPKKKAGRKSKYELLDIESKIPLIEGWIRDGHTEKSIQESLGVSHQTWNEWKKDPDKSEFNEAIKNGREMVDRLVENQLLKKIQGFEVSETEEMYDEEGNLISIKKKTKIVPSDTTSIIFWLKNRKPDQWSERITQQIEHSGSVKNVVQSLSDEELEKELKRLKGEE